MRLLIRYRILVTFLFAICLIQWFNSKTSLLDIEELAFLDWASLLFLFSIWIIIAIDMICTDIFQKTFWILSLLILPFFAPALYLFQRKRLEHLRRPFSVGNKKEG